MSRGNGSVLMLRRNRAVSSSAELALVTCQLEQGLSGTRRNPFAMLSMG
jgi:hypothetical protein